MKQTHLVQDKATGLFFKYNNETRKAEPTASRNQADIFTLEAAFHVARLYYNTESKEQFDVFEASLNDWLTWRGRIGGSTTSERKAKAVRKNGLKGGYHKKFKNKQPKFE